MYYILYVCTVQVLPYSTYVEQLLLHVVGRQAGEQQGEKEETKKKKKIGNLSLHG
jgi:hypothetical protein